MSDNKKKYGLSAIHGAVTGFITFPAALAAGAASLLAAGNAGAGENLTLGAAFAGAVGVGVAVKSTGKYLAKKSNQGHSSGSFDVGLLGGAAGFLLSASIIAENLDLNNELTQPEPIVFEQSL